MMLCVCNDTFIVVLRLISDYITEESDKEDINHSNAAKKKCIYLIIDGGVSLFIKVTHTHTHLK